MAVTYRSALLALVLLSCCGPARFASESGDCAEVGGTVLYRPSFDQETVWPPISPTDTASRPLEGAIVRLLKYSETAILLSNLVAETSTDSLGQYKLCVPPGHYWLTVFAPDGKAPVLSTESNDFRVDLPINEAKEISPGAGDSVVCDFALVAVGTM